jgi:ribose 5-phosphate isomerase B
MKIVLGADHAGYKLKNAIIKHLEKNHSEYELIDVGTNSDESVDYPIYGARAANKVSTGEADLAILCCGSGIGISIVANKQTNVRCVLANNEELAEMGRKHNGANALALGERMIDEKLAFKIVDKFLSTDVDQEDRHQRRIKLIEKKEV